MNLNQMKEQKRKLGKSLQDRGLYLDLIAPNDYRPNQDKISLKNEKISPAQDMVNQLLAAYTSGDRDALSSVVANHAYTQQRNQESCRASTAIKRS